MPVTPHKRARFQPTANTPSQQPIPIYTHDHTALDFSDRSESEEDPSSDSDRSVGSSRPSTPQTTKRPSTSQTPTPSKRSNQNTPTQASFLQTWKADSEGAFVQQTPSDAYFTAVSRSAKTSSNVFSSLLPALTQKEYNAVLASSSVHGKNSFEINDLKEYHASRFDTWLLELQAGFNLLFYGYGSKREVLNQLAEDTLSEQGDVVVVNGLFPKMGARDLLGRIESSVPEVKDVVLPASSSSSSSSTSIDLLAWKIHHYYQPPRSATDRKADFPLFILIHSFDLSSLKTSASKTILGILASSPRIHLMLSLEHIHSPLLFSTTELYSRPPPLPTTTTTTTTTADISPLSIGKGSWNMLWHDLTTIQPYDHELSFRATSSHLPTTASTQAGLTATEEGARFILISVTDPARRLFKSLCLSILSSPDIGGGGGSSAATPGWAVETDLFFRSCQEKWIAREEVRFKALLAEFKDHRLILESGVPPVGKEDSVGEVEEEGGEGGTRPGGRGRGKANARWLWVPLGREAIARLVNDLEDVDG